MLVLMTRGEDPLRDFHRDANKKQSNRVNKKKLEIKNSLVLLTR